MDREWTGYEWTDENAKKFKLDPEGYLQLWKDLSRMIWADFHLIKIALTNMRNAEWDLNSCGEEQETKWEKTTSWTKAMAGRMRMMERTWDEWYS